jgi:hypothetical protein
MSMQDQLTTLEAALREHYPHELAGFPCPNPSALEALEAVVGPLGAARALYEWRNGSGESGFLKRPTDDVLDGGEVWFTAEEASAKAREWRDCADDDAKLAKVLHARMLPMFGDGSGDVVFADLEVDGLPLARLDHETRRWTKLGLLSKAVEAVTAAVRKETWALRTGADPLATIEKLLAADTATWSEADASKVFLTLLKAAERGIEAALVHRHRLDDVGPALVEIRFCQATKQPERLFTLFADPAYTGLLLQRNQIQANLGWFAEVGREDLAVRAWELVSPLGEGDPYDTLTRLEVVGWLSRTDPPRARAVVSWLLAGCELEPEDPPHVHVQVWMRRAEVHAAAGDRAAFQASLESARALLGSVPRTGKKPFQRMLDDLEQRLSATLAPQ